MRAFRECVYVCVSLSLCGWVLVHVCTQTINMIKVDGVEENTIHEIGMHTHSSMRLLMMMTKSAWMAKMTTLTNCFFPVAFQTCCVCVCVCVYLCLSVASVYILICVRLFRHIHLSLLFFLVFVFGFTFLNFFRLYFPYIFSHTLWSSAGFSVFIFCTLRINLPKA